MSRFPRCRKVGGRTGLCRNSTMSIAHLPHPINEKWPKNGHLLQFTPAVRPFDWAGGRGHQWLSLSVNHASPGLDVPLRSTPVSQICHPHVTRVRLPPESVTIARSPGALTSPLAARSQSTPGAQPRAPPFVATPAGRRGPDAGARQHRARTTWSMTLAAGTAASSSPPRRSSGPAGSAWISIRRDLRRATRERQTRRRGETGSRSGCRMP